MATQTDDSLATDEPQVNGLTLKDAITEYISTVAEKEKQFAHPEISKFMRWIGPDRLVATLLPSDIDHYGETLGTAASDAHKKRVEVVKDFLNFLKKKHYLEDSLAKHIRIRKPSYSGARQGVMRRRDTEVQITRQGYDDMTKQLGELRIETVRISEDIEKAAASGDVRENAPLEAARENQGMVQSQIYRLESTLKSAVIIDESVLRSRDLVQIGSWVKLMKIVDGSMMEYQVVAANEANPLKGKISDISPVGSAILGRKPDDEVRVKTPGGAQRFKIDSIF